MRNSSRGLFDEPHKHRLRQWLVKTSDATLWRIDDLYKAAALWVFYLAPVDMPHRTGGALYALTELEQHFEIYDYQPDQTDDPTT